jgi:uncharacterized membrane protein YphA (DoxX/SURF4 family)
MDAVPRIGRLFFATAIALLGIQQIICTDFVQGPLIAPAWLPLRTPLACLSGLALVVAGAGVALAPTRWARQAALLLAVVLAVTFLLFHLPTPGPILRDGIARTRAFETLAMLGVALVLAGPAVVAAGRILFAITRVVFGVQHFMYDVFVAAVIPAWIPARLFWAYFTGVAFVAAGVSLIAGKAARPAALLLGLMFFLWVVLLHAPRVGGQPGDTKEWNSAFVALAMCGAAWLLVQTPTKNELRPTAA